jgi:hypothetical protein
MDAAPKTIPPTRASACCQYLLTGLIALALAGAIWTHARDREHNGPVVRRLTTGSMHIRRAGIIDRMDAVLHKDVPQHGNIFLRFEDMNAERNGMLLYELFMRASYTFYPRHVYIGPEDAPYTDAETMLSWNQLPSTAWLDEHGVEVVLTFRKNAAGDPVFEVRKRGD